MKGGGHDVHRRKIFFFLTLALDGVLGEDIWFAIDGALHEIDGALDGAIDARFDGGLDDAIYGALMVDSGVIFWRENARFSRYFQNSRAQIVGARAILLFS